MLPSLKYSDTNSENRYGYSIGGGGGNHNNNGTGGGAAAAAAHYNPDSSHYYSGVYPNAGGGIGAFSAYSGASSYGPSGFKNYSNAVVDQAPGSQTPLTIIDPPTEPKVRSYLLWSIFNLICCGFLCGLVTTIFSVRILSLADRRLFKEAQRLSDRLMFINIIITTVGGLLFILVFPYVYTAVYPSLPKINY